MTRRVITLTTDFGSKDAFVGIMKGVILKINPEAEIVDLSHEISPQNIKEAAFLLCSAYHYFPYQTIHVVVVDPGVGTKRRPILAENKDYFFIAPDNGVLGLIYKKKKNNVYHITNTKYFLPNVSQTFHGRDIFAPVAAYLSLGILPKEMGTKITDYEKGKWPFPKIKDRVLLGKIIYIDHFGNLITNIHRGVFKKFVKDSRFLITIKDIDLKDISPHYLAVPRGEILAIWGSSEYLEICQSMGSAKMALNAKVGETIGIKIKGAN